MPDTIMNIFDGDAFSNVTLTAIANENYPYVPGLLSDMNLAPAQGMLTLDAAFDEIVAGIRMISTSPRGAPPSQIEHPRGQMRRLQSVHMARQVTVNADELLNARARGTFAPQTFQNLLRERVDGPVGVKVQLEMTLEHMLLGMVQGIVYDADNATVLYNFYTWLNVSPPSTITIPFSTATTDTGVIAKALMGIKRQLILALNGFPVGAGARAVALCGDNFYDDVLFNKEMVKAKQTGALGNQDAADIISRNTPYSAVMYGGVLFINYRGTVGSEIQIATDDARLFMAGVPGLFQRLYAPADTFETVAAMGLPYYLLNDPNRQNTEKRAVFELQTNPLFACLRPGSLFRLTRG